MNILLIYFSGTSNSEYVAEMIKKDFLLYKHDVDLLSIDCESETPSIDRYDMIGIGYPIHAFNSPKILDRFLKRLPKSDKPYFIFKTSGETLKYNDASSRRIIRMMKRKHYILKGEYHFAMPYNLVFRFEEEFVKQLLYYASLQSKILVHNISSNRIETIKSNLYYNLFADVLLIQRMGAFLNSFLYRVDEKRCTSCQKCLIHCPEHNIYLKDDKIKFHHHCMMCMRCSFNCPKDAIKIGFLNHWKVNEGYHLSTVSLEALNNEYASKNKKHFYRCYRKYFAEIDRRTNEINTHK